MSEESTYNGNEGASEVKAEGSAEDMQQLVHLLSKAFQKAGGSTNTLEAKRALLNVKPPECFRLATISRLGCLSLTNTPL